MLKLACNFNVDVSAPNVDIKGGYGFDPGQCGSGSGAGIKSSTVVNAFDLIVFKITIGQWQILVGALILKSINGSKKIVKFARQGNLERK